MSLTPSQSTAVAIPDDDDDNGLEDFSDIVTPTIKLDHPRGVFIDSLSQEEFPTMRVILLGLVKQRVLWPPDVAETPESPLCRSYDFKIGRPDPAKFPLAKSGFPAIPESGELPCDSCKLKDWETHPKREKISWCSAQYTLPLLRIDEDGNMLPSLLTLQRSSLPNCNRYLSSFKAKGTGLFTVETSISLETIKRGSVVYSVPKFSNVGPSERDEWESYGQQFRQIRDYLRRPRVQADADASAPQSAPTPAAPAPAPAPTQAPAPAPQSAPEPVKAEVVDDDDLPF